MFLERTQTQMDVSVSLNHDFQSMTQDISKWLAVEGIRCRPFLPGMPYFTQLPIEKKQEIVQNVRFYHELCQEQMSEGYQIKDSLTFTWRALNRLGLVPRSDLFSNVSDGDILEVYSGDGRQLYRNFLFFDFCSYTLEELYSLEWWSLFNRDAEITGKLYDIVGRIFTGEIEGSVIPDCVPHVVSEACSEEKIHMLYEPKMISPLYRNKVAEAVIAIVRCQIIKN
jgi:hypothetical protein